MTPNEHLEKLRKDYLKDIEQFFKENNLKSICLHIVNNNLGLDIHSLNDKGILFLVDEYGNDYDTLINDMGIEAIGHILTLIQTQAYDISD
jgi:hypothetical protein